MNLIEALKMPFVQNAFIAGFLVALAAGYYGAFVVQRGMSFLGDGLAHAAFGGVALGLLLNMSEPLYVAAPFTLAVALGIMWIRDKTTLGSDTAIGVFFALSVALGVVFISMRQQYTVDAFNYLFGSIILISRSDIWTAAGLAFVAACSSALWPRWAYATFDREIAQTDGLRVSLEDYILVGLIAVTVVVAVKLVGIVLIASFLVIPAASSRLISRSFAAMTLYSMAFAGVSAVIGLAASVLLDFPSGATMILAMSGLFFCALVFSRIKQ